MFKEDADWSDEEGAQILSNAILPDSQKSNTNLKAKQCRVVGRKSLMRTLQTLGTVPEWKIEDRQEDSDSDATNKSPRKKKKKKRNRKRKHAETSEEHQKNGDEDETVEEKKAVPNNKKKDADFRPLKLQKKSSSEPKEKKAKVFAEAIESNPESKDRLSRQQWKTKMKNKRKCKNKYQQEKPQEEVKEVAAKQEKKEDLKTDLNSNTNCDKTSPTTTQKKQLEKKSSLNKEKLESGAEKQQKHERNAPESKDNKITEQQQKKQKTVLSKDQSLKREKLRKLLQNQRPEQHEDPIEEKNESEAPEGEEKVREKEEVDHIDSTSLRSRMEQRLESARFRYINEVLYTTTSGDAKRMFKQDPQAFWVYHKGYTAQVQRWPSNPLDAIISFIRQKPASLVVADFGCGDCKIARSVKNKVHSFDLAATCELVTVCDMVHVPLKDSSVDIGVFCLSLMGTNLAEFLAEANRVLKKGGVLKVAEVASRFEDVRNFVTALSKLGFKMVSKNTDNTHFYSFEFLKTGNTTETIKKFGLQLKPCVYKKR